MCTVKYKYKKNTLHVDAIDKFSHDLVRTATKSIQYKYHKEIEGYKMTR